MTLVQGVVNAFVMFLARVLAYILSGLGKSEKSSTSSYLMFNVLVFVFQIVFMILGSIVIAAYSRFREFRADKGGAYLAGRDKMIAALEALRRTEQIRLQTPCGWLRKSPRRNRMTRLLRPGLKSPPSR